MSNISVTNSTYQTGGIDTRDSLDATSNATFQQMNGAASAPIAIQTILGDGPTLKGNKATLAERLNEALDANGKIVGHTLDSRTNTVADGAILNAETTGTPATGIGTALLMQAKSIDELPSDTGRIGFIYDDISAGSEDTRLAVWTRVAGAALIRTYEWVATNPFKAIFIHANSEDRTYTLPNLSTTLLGTSEGGAAIDVGKALFRPRQFIETYEDFESRFEQTAGTRTIGKYPWVHTNAGGQSLVNSVSARGGIWRIYQDNVSNFAVGVVLENGTHFYAAANPRISVRFCADANRNSGSFMWAGLTDTSFDANPANGLFFRVTMNSGNYIAVARSGNVETILDTTVAHTSGTLQEGELVLTNGGTNIEVFFGGVSRGVITSNIPTGGMRLGCGTTNSDTSTAGIRIDYLYCKQDR